MKTRNWKIDTTHSYIGFKIKHMMFTNLKGNFEDYNATISFPEGEFEKATIQFEAQVASINTKNTDRDIHLKSADFFDAEQFPLVTFQSTDIEKKTDSLYIVKGDLTMHGVTNSITLEAEYSGELKDPWNNTKIALTLTGNIKRKDWGLNWNSTLETGGVLVSDEVKFEIETQFSL